MKKLTRSYGQAVPTPVREKDKDFLMTIDGSFKMPGRGVNCKRKM